MALILAIEPDRAQAAQLTNLIDARLRAELLLAATTEEALAVIGSRVPDLVLVPALLSPQDDAALAGALRVIAAAARVRMLTIPVLAECPPPPARRGMLAKLRRRRAAPPAPNGCDPAVFAEQIAAYLAEAAAERPEIPEMREIDQTPATEPGVDPSVTELIDEPIAHFAHAMAPPIESPIEEPIAQAIEQPIVRPIEQSIEQPIAQLIEELIAQPIEPPVMQSIDEPIASEVADPIDEPIAIEAPAMAASAETEVDLGVEVDLDAELAELEAEAESTAGAPSFAEPLAPVGVTMAAIEEVAAARMVESTIAASDRRPVEERPAAEYVSQAELDRRFFAEGGLSRLRLDPRVPVRPPTPVPPPPPVAAVAAVPPAPPKAERPEWIELIESLRLDLERLRTERPGPAEGRANQPPPQQMRSTEDQWDLFDPEQCGFAALVAKLEEITEANENVSA